MRFLPSRPWLALAAVALAGCGVKPTDTGYQVQQVGLDQGLCRIGLERCQSINGYGSIDCIDRYQYCLTVMGPRGGYVPPSQRGFPPPLPPPPPPTAFGPPSPGEDVYYSKSEPSGPPQTPQQPGRIWGWRR